MPHLYVLCASSPIPRTYFPTPQLPTTSTFLSLTTPAFQETETIHRPNALLTTFERRRKMTSKREKAESASRSRQSLRRVLGTPANLHRSSLFRGHVFFSLVAIVTYPSARSLSSGGAFLGEGIDAKRRNAGTPSIGQRSSPLIEGFVGSAAAALPRRGLLPLRSR